VAADLASEVLDPTVFPAGVNLLLQGGNLVGLPIGDYADSGQTESLEFTDLFSQS
jgi:hypothetical protein